MSADLQAEIAQALASSFFSMTGGTDDMPQPKPTTGEMQLAYDVMRALRETLRLARIGARAEAINVGARAEEVGHFGAIWAAGYNHALDTVLAAGAPVEPPQGDAL